MKIIYRIISELFLLISPIIIIYRILKGKESKLRFYERYSINSKKRNNGKLIWFHCSSVGELMSIIPVIEKFEGNLNIKQILVTTTTLSSSKIFEKLKLKKTVHQFFPIDNKLIMQKFITYWKPSVFFLCESEIWPNLIYTIHEKKIKLILLNARMTSKSYKRWINLKSFSAEIFKKFDLCLTQNAETERHLKFLGVKKIRNLGNLKFSTSKSIKNNSLDKKFLNFFRQKKILITGASTHFNEENFIFQNHLYFQKKKKINNLLSIIVPRHIERCDQIKREAESYSLKTHLHSKKQNMKKNIDIYIVDTYGELNKFYKISKIVFMGGSLIAHGGQNPLEAAKLGCKIIHGPHINNFIEIYKKLNGMNVSTQFKNYNQGTKIIENKVNKKLYNFYNKKILDYGDRVLNLTYSVIVKLV